MPEYEPTQPPPPVEPEPPKESGREKAARLFAEGDFDGAAIAYAGLDEAQRTLARLGDAFRKAFPENLPDLPYAIVTTATGSEFEGFADERGGLLKLTDAAGKSMSFPNNAIASREDLSTKRARERIARQVAEEGAAPGLTGPRVFALMQAASRAGRPDVMAPLLSKALELDEKEPYFLSTVKSRVAQEHQAELYRSFAAAQAPQIIADEPAPTILDTPRRLGEGAPSTGREPEGPKIKNPKVMELLKEAAGPRKEAEALYKKLVLAGIDNAEVADVSEAIRLFDQALAKYEKAMELEDSSAVAALAIKTSKLRFTLAFMKQQLEGR